MRRWTEVRSLRETEHTEVRTMYEVHEKKQEKQEKAMRTNAVCGVATERWPRTSLYRARAGAWAARGDT